MGQLIRLASPVQFNSLVDGKGIRMVVWCQGCNVHCTGCHNPETQNPCGGKSVALDDVLNLIEKNALHHDGITLSGGDPFLQPHQCKIIADKAHSLGLNVWAYCGLTFEELKKDKNKKELLKSCDVLVDGPFIIEQRNVTLPFRGSENQRIIDVQQSLKKHKVIIWDC